MKCKECVDGGEKSIVTPHGGSKTLMGFSPWYDEDGVYHSHDGNRVTSAYSCSKGHNWTDVRHKSPCPGCDWGHGIVLPIVKTRKPQIRGE